MNEKIKRFKPFISKAQLRAERNCKGKLFLGLLVTNAATKVLQRKHTKTPHIPKTPKLNKDITCAGQDNQGPHKDTKNTNE